MDIGSLINRSQAVSGPQPRKYVKKKLKNTGVRKRLIPGRAFQSIKWLEIWTVVMGGRRRCQEDPSAHHQWENTGAVMANGERNRPRRLKMVYIRVYCTRT